MIVKELFIPYTRIKYTDEETKQEYIKTFNKKVNLYEVIYSYHDVPSNENAIVDKIFLDFDPGEDMVFFSDVRTVAKYLYDNDIEFYIRFSGRGFHIFINLNDAELKNPKMAIKQYVYDLHQKTNTKSDPAVVGDLRRPARLVNTMNLKTKRFCIPITYEELQNKTYEEIYEMATTERNVPDFINGTVKIDISAWDGKVITFKKPQNVPTIKVEVMDSFPPCIDECFKNPQLGHMERMQFMLFFRDLGYTEEEIEAIFYKYLDEEKFNHMMYDEHQIRNVCPKDYTFRTCYKQKINGFCTSDICTGCNLYY